MMKSARESALEVKELTYLYSPSWWSFITYLKRSQRDQVQQQRRGIMEMNFRFEFETIYGLVGPNGAGKSTLFKLLSGELKPQKGSLYLGGMLISKSPRWQRARLGLGYLSQQGTLVDDLSVLTNLKLGAESGKRWGALQTTQENLEINHHLGEEYLINDEELTIELSNDIFSINSLLYQKVSQLSGGERRRVELTRILLQRPKVLILDEPFAALDSSGIQETLKFLEIMKRQGAMVLLTDHQNDYIENVCDQVIHLERGIVVLVTPKEVNSREIISREVIRPLT